MYLSTDYFSPNNSLYQEGQYLTTDIIKELLNNYNQTDKLLSDNVTNPVIIKTIYEQDYVANNNNLKGISLALILDCNQSYKLDGRNYYEVLDEKEVLDFGKDRANKLLEYIRSIPELKDIKVVIGLYIESDNYVKGSFKYIGDTSKNKINLDYVNYNYKLLGSDDTSNNDINNYNNFQALKNSVGEYNLYINGIGLYKDNRLLKVDITISKNYLKQSEILSICELISKELNNFDNGIEIKVYFNSNNSRKAFLIKQDLDVKTYMMEE